MNSQDDLCDATFRLYEPNSDTYSRDGGGSTLSIGDRLELFLNEQGPKYAGEPVFDFRLSGEFKISDSLMGVVKTSADGNEGELEVPGYRGSKIYAGLKKSAEGGDSNVGIELPIGSLGFIDINSSGKTKLGIGISPKLKEIPDIFVPVEANIYGFIAKTGIGIGADTRVLSANVSGEAEVGWGRGRQMFDIVGDMWLNFFERQLFQIK